MKKLILSALSIIAFAVQASALGPNPLVIVSQTDTAYRCGEYNPLLIVVLQDNYGGSTVVWKIDDIVDTTYNLPDGANGISLFATQPGTYTCEITNQVGMITSAPITVLNVNIFGLTIVEADDVLSLSETPTNMGNPTLTIDWYKDGEQIGSGATINVQGPGSYTATVYYTVKAPICSATTPAFLATGIYSQIANTAVNLYPNPANNMVNVTSTMQVLTADVYDATGRLVLSNRAESTNNINLNVASLSNGIYNIKLTHTNGLVAVKKLIKY